MTDPRDRRSYRQRQALRQRAKRLKKRQPRKLTKAEYGQIAVVLLAIALIVFGSIWLAERVPG